LDFLELHNLRLPDAAQKLIEACNTRPDFLYTDQSVAIYIDGPDHDLPDIAARDRQVTECLVDSGYTIVRFGYLKTQWIETCRQHIYIWDDLAN